MCSITRPRQLGYAEDYEVVSREETKNEGDFVKRASPGRSRQRVQIHGEQFGQTGKRVGGGLA